MVFVIRNELISLSRNDLISLSDAQLLQRDVPRRFGYQVRFVLFFVFF